METLFPVLTTAHWLGAALIIIGWGLSFGRNAIHPAMVWGARLQLLIGLGIVGVLEGLNADVNHMFVGIKLVIALAVVALCEIAAKKAKKGEAKMALVHAAGALAVANTIIASVFMR
ncbi:MAG: hypothetical protein Q4G51_16975 [Dermatophilus congolensis]|nr:hypothetical protein [Dermatophilus congolensis]